jgi:hypothetical protein
MALAFFSYRRRGGAPWQGNPWVASVPLYISGSGRCVAATLAIELRLSVIGS